MVQPIVAIKQVAARPKHVVVLDRDEVFLRSVENRLKAAGYRVTATTDPKLALEVTVRQAADAFISDIVMMPPANHLIHSVIAHAAPRTSRLLVTSESDFSVVARVASPYAVNGFLAKRDAEGQLVAVVHELVSGKPEHDESAMSEEARGLARSIVRALALRAYETEAHCERVAAWAGRVAEALSLSASRMLDVELGALMHDVGQIGVRDAVLLKPGKLDENEWIELRKHPDIGVSLIEEVPALRRAIPIVQCHHERWDGGGYPRNLRGRSIPLDARIFHVADTFDAITSDRPHRPGRSDEDARGEILRNAGTQFDPEVCEAFAEIDALDWRATVAHLL